MSFIQTARPIKTSVGAIGGLSPVGTSPTGSAAAVAVSMARSILTAQGQNGQVGAVSPTHISPTSANRNSFGFRASGAVGTETEALTSMRQAEARTQASEVTQLRYMVQRQETAIQDQERTIEAMRAEISALRRAMQMGQPQVSAAPVEISHTVPPVEAYCEVVTGVKDAAVKDVGLIDAGLKDVGLVDAGLGEAPKMAASFVMWLDKSSGGELGIELDEGTLAVTVVDQTGLVADWNQSNPAEACLPGARIVEVNGAQEVDQIVDRLIKDAVLEVCFVRE